ncbi:MAG TPA: class I SAM-dependent methyltransferase [Leptolinea sp.]
MEHTHLGLFESATMQNVTGNTIRPGGLDLTNRALEFCEFSKDSTLLDIGCGLGSTQQLLINRGFQSFGLDASQKQLRTGIQNTIPGIRAYGEAVPFPATSLDGVFLECTLSVVKNPTEVLAEVYRLLKPGGMLVLSDIFARNELGIPALKSAGASWCFNTIWSRIDCSTMLQSAGLKIVLWEDHSEKMRNLTGKIILKHGSLNSFWECLNLSQNCSSFDALNFQLLLSRAKLGFFLLIAQKPDFSS